MFVAAVIATGGYFAHAAWKSQRSEYALKSTVRASQPLKRALAPAKSLGQTSAGGLLSHLAPDVTSAARRSVYERQRQAGDQKSGYELSRMDYESPRCWR